MVLSEEDVVVERYILFLGLSLIYWYSYGVGKWGYEWWGEYKVMGLKYGF